MTGLVGFFGFNGIRKINDQNIIGAIANRILVDAEDAQAHALRYLIYKDETYHQEMTTELNTVLSLAERAKSLMKSNRNKQHIEELDTAAVAYRKNNEDLYNVSLEKQGSGAIRVEKALNIVEALIAVVSAAKEFSLTTEIKSNGRSYLDKASVERVWIVQDARVKVVESSSAIQQMVSSMGNVTDNMGFVSQSTKALNNASATGLEKMQRSHDLIKKIAEESKKLMETNQLINGIASQTSLLAMKYSMQWSSRAAAVSKYWNPSKI